MVDQTMFSRNPYDEHGPYDLGFSSEPSRPLPVPYDDPYSDTYTPTTPGPSTSTNIGTSENVGGFSRNQARHGSENHLKEGSIRRGHDRGRGRGRGRGRERQRERGGQDHNEYGGGSYNGAEDPQRVWGDGNLRGKPRTSQPYASRSSHEPHITRPLSPTSLTIARATGQLLGGSNYIPQYPYPNAGTWGHAVPPFLPGQPFQFEATHGYPQQLVQPHINPRFAAAFGMNLGIPQSQSPHFASQNGTFGQVNQNSDTESNWTDEWVVQRSASNGSDVGS